MTEYKEIDDSIVTKGLSFLVLLYLLVSVAVKGVAFSYWMPRKLVGVFVPEAFTYKLTHIYFMMLVIVGASLVLIILSIVFSRIHSKNNILALSAVYYEIAGSALPVIASLVYYLIFRTQCLLSTDLKESMLFIGANLWLVFALGYKIYIAVKDKAETTVKLLIPGIAITALSVAVSMLFVMPVFIVKCGYENYNRDLPRINERFETEGCNSLHGGVSIDDTLYLVCSFPVEGSDEYTKFISLDSNGSIEVIDDQFIAARTVAKHEDTVFYSKYKHDEEYGFMIGSYDVNTGMTDVFNSNHVSADRKYVFGSSTYLLGVRGDYLYITVSEQKEIWRVKIKDGILDKKSLEKYAWSIGEDELAVCYANLDQWETDGATWPWYWIMFENGESDFWIEQWSVPNYELEAEIHMPYSYLQYISAKPHGQTTGGTSIIKTVAANVYNSEVYYAVIEDGILMFYRSNLDLTEKEFLGSIEVDVNHTYEYSYASRIIVSDSYLVYFNYDCCEVIVF